MANIDDNLVNAIAQRVIAAINAKPKHAAPAEIHAPIGECTGDYSKFKDLKANIGAPAPASALKKEEPKAPAIEITTLKGVITLEKLKSIKGPIQLAPGARLTPLAQDYMNAKQLNLTTAGPSTKPSIITQSAPSFQKGTTMQNIFQLKQEMCEVGHRIWMKSFCAGNEGNHSVRIGEDRVLSTPTGISKGFLRPDQIVTVDMDGNQIDKENKHKRTSEILMHLAVYKKRPDVKAVIHSHPPHATAFAVADVPIPEGIHPEAEVFLGRVPTARYFTPGDKQVGESVCALIKPDTNTVMMGNHGSVSFSTSLIDAYYKLEILDAYCRILLLTKQIGKINPLTKDQMVQLLKVKGNFGMQDSRLSCAPTGCVGADNEPFLSSFPDANTSTDCNCHSPAPQSDANFEALVKQVTDQIMAGMKK